jgi:aminoglycoside phosphotransferase (APT) family kinase protein
MRFRTPGPIAIGEPGAGYPLPWSVQTWLPGTVATEQDPSSSIDFAYDPTHAIAYRSRPTAMNQTSARLHLRTDEERGTPSPERVEGMSVKPKPVDAAMTPWR